MVSIPTPGPGAEPPDREAAWRGLVAPVLRLARARTALAVGLEAAHGDGALGTIAAELGLRVSTAPTLEALAGPREEAWPDAILRLGGDPSWHTVRRDLEHLARASATRAARLPIVLLEAAAPEPVPSWLSPHGRARQHRRNARRASGIALAARAFADAHSRGATALWMPDQGLGLLIEHSWIESDPALAALITTLDGVLARWAHEAEVAGGSSSATLELLDRFEQLARASRAVIESRRYRVANRVVRSLRRALGKSRGFPPQKTVLQLTQDDAPLRPVLDALFPGRDPAQTRTGALRVTYVLPQVTVNGGVLGVSQLANELTLLGADARIATLKEQPDVHAWRFLRRPQVFASPAHLIESFPPSDIAVATHWTTARWVRDAIDRGRAAHGVYFLQDYEAWFFPEHDAAARDEVRRTYALLPHRIVKSEWLLDLLRADGYPAHKIPLGMDLAFFHPRPVARPPHPVVFAMARPRTPRRGFPSVVAALTLVKEAMPEVEIVLFGQDLSRMTLPFAYRGEGVVADQDHLARLYSQADVHLDGSDFQAFGRPALEAMACGTPCVLTGVGGVTEYARHEANCLLVPPAQPRAFADAILRLLRDEALRARLRAGGLATVLDYCLKREARDTLAHFMRICGAAPAPTLASAAAAR